MELEEVRGEAERGVVASQVVLGALALYGSEGVPQDYREASKWLQAASEQGAPRAKQLLAAVYLYGLGVARDELRARSLLSEAAMQGYAPAALELARLSSYRGTVEEAVRWYRVVLEARASGRAGKEEHDWIAQECGDFLRLTAGLRRP